MTLLADRGLEVDVPPGWEGRIFTPRLPPPAENHPVLHLADIPLPFERSSYVETAATLDGRRGGLVCSLVSFAPELADVGLYAPQGVPRIHARDLDPRALQIPVPNGAGVQRFFSVNGRPFSLYIVASVDRHTAARLRIASDALASLRVEVEPA
jgi:hypothetical protein